MEKLKLLLNELKYLGAIGIKISFEDEGALLNEMMTMRYLTTVCDLEMSVKIGGCEAKRDIVDCIHLNADTIVAPMIESKFALDKFLISLNQYKYTGKKGFNLETIQAYNNLNDIENSFDKIDFVTVGRVDFVGSLNKSRDFVDSDEILNIVRKVFNCARIHNIQCYLGGAISINSSSFINNLIKEKILDKFETRYIIFDASKINNLENALYLANLFEVEWLKYINKRYELYANKDIKRIEMIENRLNNNPNKKIRHN